MKICYLIYYMFFLYTMAVNEYTKKIVDSAFEEYKRIYNALIVPKMANPLRFFYNIFNFVMGTDFDV